LSVNVYGSDKNSQSSFVETQVLAELSVSVATNGLRIGDGGAFEKRQPNICTNTQ